MTPSKIACHSLASFSLGMLLLFGDALNLRAAMPDDSPNGLRLWYTQPAEKWTEALPIGNGRLGAMVYGGVDQERLQLNEDTLWSGGPHSYDNSEAYGHLATVRGLLETGEYAKAEETAQKMLGKHKYQQAYMPFGYLILDFPKSEEPSDYRRELNLQNAVSTVSYRVDNACFARKVFASHPDQCIVMQLGCDTRKQISFDLSLTSPQEFKSQANADNTLLMTGYVAPRADGRANGARGLIAPWEKDGLRFAAQVKVIAEGGTVVAHGDKISVKNADVVTLVYVAATSFVDYQDVSGDPVKKVADYASRVRGKSFEQLLQRHVDDYSSLFGRVAIDLGGDKTESLPTDERIRRVREGGVDPLLDAQVFQFGRYLMISGSRPGTQPLNLQGIWNDELDPSWGSKYTININIQMNYWVAEVCNLSECHEPLLRMVDELQKPGRNTAKVHYRAGGWVAHHNTDLWRGTAPVDGAQWGMWPMGGAWLCKHLWEHYLFTGDAEHLKKSYPILKGAVEFFLDTLVENEDGFLITSPSISPEHSHGGGTKDGLSVGRSGVSLCAGPTIDMQLLRDLFSSCIAASEILDLDQEFRSKVQQIRSRLQPMKIGRHGQLQEWMVDWDNPEDQHSHVSHLYGLYPSSQINRRDTPELFKAAQTSLIQRGDTGGWPGAWRVCLWARLGDGNRAHNVLSNHVMPRFAENLFNKGSVYQIDANFGATAGIAEMLLQSHGGEIHLLPALPEAWPTGSVQGLRARGGFEVDIDWKDGRLIQAKIRSLGGSLVKVGYGGETREISLGKGETYAWNQSTGSVDSDSKLNVQHSENSDQPQDVQHVRPSAVSRLWNPNDSSAFEVGTQLRAWTIQDEGMDYVLENMQSMCGVNNVYMVVVMHEEHRPFQAPEFPHNPARDSWQAEDSRVTFFPDMDRYGTVKPLLSDVEWIRKTDWLRLLVDACRSRGLAVGAEVSHFPIPKSIIEDHPDWQQRKIDGSSWSRSRFCPNNPEVREYVIALFGDLAANYDLDYIQTCQHLFDRNNAIEMGGTCFCRHCIAEAKKIGFDLEAAIPTLQSNPDSQPEKHNWLKLRRHSTTEFYRLISEEIKQERLNPRCHLRYNDTYPYRGWVLEDVGMHLDEVAPYLGSLVNQDHQEQKGDPNETFSRRMAWLEKNRRLIGPDMPLVTGIAARMKATPELVKAGIKVAIEHPARVNGLALKHYDGASFGLMRAFKQGMIEAGVQGLSPIIGKEVEEMQLDNFRRFDDFVEEWGAETMGKGSASYRFDNVSGNYDIRITYFDEEHGQSDVRLFVGDEEVIRFKLDEDVDCWRWRRFEKIRVNTGDEVILVAESDQQERVRLDFVEFIPAKQ
ncbi:hypothetical protein CA13_21820 [Planctomycetes bacterium CA13]|uniref:Uncharacterized protein n=1 Tax=Novipirellula herctigrandis TaxID=2527986 RepID=A0A5C5Z141_9BACT|nr:hypothetical protein CA13_21820 [Planctomycetes bacterium CA13]